jgi:competence protein ComEC
VAGYQGGFAAMRAGVDTPLGARLALIGAREITGLVLISLLAGFATMLYSAYHFHRLTPYGVLTNLLTMPIVSFWIMPAGIAGVVALPFGFDGFFWRLMGAGIEWMVAVSVWVASLPGAVGRVTAFGTGPLLLGSAGLIVLGLLRSPLRWTGALLVAVAVFGAIRTPLPDVLIAPDGASFAVRTAGGRLAMLRTGSDSFAIQQWLAADADARSAKDKELAEGIRCDDAGCVGRLGDGAIVAIARRPEAFEEDCRRAAVVVSTRMAPPDCAALVVDRAVWQRGGAIALRHVGGKWVISAARPPGLDRPWARGRPSAEEVPASVTPQRREPRDATPRTEDMEPGG